MPLRDAPGLSSSGRTILTAEYEAGEKKAIDVMGYWVVVQGVCWMYSNTRVQTEKPKRPDVIVGYTYPTSSERTGTEGWKASNEVYSTF